MTISGDLDLSQLPTGDWLSGLLRVRPVVLDTSPLTCDVISVARTRGGMPSPLLVALRIGVLRGYAASHVWAEVPRVLARRAGRARIPVEVLEAIWWNEYVPLVKFVDCTGLPTTDQATNLTRRDPSDANTLVLAGLIAPVVVIAEDRDIVASGLAYEQWRDFYNVAETITTGRSYLTGATGLVVLAGHGLVGAGRMAARAARNPWIVAAAALCTLLLGRYANGWVPQLRTTWREGVTGRREYGEALARMLVIAASRVRRAEATWNDAERGEAGAPLLHRLARVLAVADAPMTRTELMHELGQPARRATMAALADLLSHHPAFHEATRGRWQLGRDRMDFGGFSLP
ncbi:hypothetical protein ABT369_26585 [Dactylosporangium sp. NPDC000244]|uniref:hypothetical protein n=1 Tax=Dactylosporangium sp. NPDC000244 TaxID=3154365 RepID=UPI00331824EF